MELSSGEYSLQSLLYDYIIKCYHRPGVSPKWNIYSLFDWFNPKYYHQTSREQLEQIIQSIDCVESVDIVTQVSGHFFFLKVTDWYRAWGRGVLTNQKGKRLNDSAEPAWKITYLTLGSAKQWDAGQGEFYTKKLMRWEFMKLFERQSFIVVSFVPIWLCLSWTSLNSFSLVTTKCLKRTMPKLKTTNRLLLGDCYNTS